MKRTTLFVLSCHIIGESELSEVAKWVMQPNLL